MRKLISVILLRCKIFSTLVYDLFYDLICKTVSLLHGNPQNIVRDKGVQVLIPIPLPSRCFSFSLSTWKLHFLPSSCTFSFSILEFLFLYACCRMYWFGN